MSEEVGLGHNNPPADFILGLDLASRKTGWCVGDGSAVPYAGAFIWPHVGEDYGELGLYLWKELDGLRRRFPRIGRIVYESPILVVADPNAPEEGRHTDKLEVIRKLYGLGMVLETYCKIAGLACNEESLQALKTRMTGMRHASKEDMVRGALALGVSLPETFAQGREDAADAVAAWLIGIRHYARPYAADWDQRLARSRGGLI